MTNIFDAFSKSFLYLTLLCLAISENVVSSKQKRASKFVFKDGDVIIGGLSPVHFSPLNMEGQDPDEFTCQGEFNTCGFEAVETMLFTMDMLNEGALKNKVLPNITVGMDIKETCTNADNAVRESLQFSFIRNANMQGKCSADESSNSRETKTVAVVGAAYSGVSMAVTNLCGLFYVPLVSYGSTSRLLSNKVQFRYFFRTVPSDMLQAQVMADLVRAMNWNYVITLASDTEYGRSGIEAFKQAAQSFDDYDICIPVDETFTKRSDQKTFKRIFRRMRETPKAKVVILFAELHDAKILMDKIREQGINEKYIWIGSDAWADSKQVLKGNEEILNGMFAIVPEVRKIGEFMEYFVNFNEKRRKRNPWMHEYEDEKVAYDPAFHRQTFVHYPKAPYVMDAVLAVAYALHNFLGCEPYKDCSSKKYKISSPQFQKTFVRYLEKVRFPGMSRDTMYFDESGDAIGIYDIRHLKLVGENYDFFKIGRWGSGNCGLNSSKSCLELQKQKTDQRLMNSTWEGLVPFSRCSATCSVGYHKVSAELAHAKCCWTCRKCTGRTVSNTTDREFCFKCPNGYWSNSDNSKCEAIKPNILHWLHPAGLVLCISMGLGSVAVIFAFIVFVIYRETPVVKASSRELCYVLLFGIGWCFVIPVFYLLEPTDMICRIIPFATGLCPSLVVGTLLTKTNRISRIFNRKLSKAGAPACLSKKWQLLMVACITLVEMFICSLCTYFSDIGRNVVTFDNKNELIIECRSLPDIWVAIWWAYIVGLVVTCTYQVFLTRKLPENYNESKFISFAMLTTCIVVIMYIPTYNGTSGIYRTVVTCSVFVIGGSTAYGCIFVPKLYIILWRPEKNVPMQPRTQSIRLGTISPSSSFIRRLSIDQNAAQHEMAPSFHKHRSSLPFVDAETQKEMAEIRKHVASRSKSISVDILNLGRSNNEFFSETVVPKEKRGRPARKLIPLVSYSSNIDKIEEGIEQNMKSDNENVGRDETNYTDSLPIVQICRYQGDYIELPTSELEDSDQMLKSESEINDSEPNYSDQEWDHAMPKNIEVPDLSESSCFIKRSSTTCTSKTESEASSDDISREDASALYAAQDNTYENSFSQDHSKVNNTLECICANGDDLEDATFNLFETHNKQSTHADEKNSNNKVPDKNIGQRERNFSQHKAKKPNKNNPPVPKQDCDVKKSERADSNCNHVSNKRPPSDGLIITKRIGNFDFHSHSLSKSVSYPANEFLGTSKSRNRRKNGISMHSLNAPTMCSNGGRLQKVEEQKQNGY
ncbi:metabotropic glutamate receptor 2-like [Actinia tenebrosa]|uniref:Metabotropic glutamate receptor 2-like n=1 Tax=Actinia tenebrosa TaxID=6105 RepID=A0A6P8I3H8_ACTTE|nr:metabotropic glutamate receptor 2-like [Actinia tenebrosa]XP_031562051.1 metabotropic glutamate receptor 2-like [Actinia tenebrosa]